MKMINLFRKVIALNLLPCVLFIAVFSLLTLVPSCKKELAGTCESCSKDSDCETGLNCVTFQNPSSGATYKRCASGSGVFCD